MNQKPVPVIPPNILHQNESRVPVIHYRIGNGERGLFSVHITRSHKITPLFLIYFFENKQ